MTKVEAYREADKRGAGFLANVIMNWQTNPAKKLKGLVNLLRADHTVDVASRDLTILMVDGCMASWVVLEEWANRAK